MNLSFDPRDISRADVYKAGTKAATIGRESEGISFRYDAEYLARSGWPVATTLPLTDEPTRTLGGALPPFFTGLLPEGRRLTSLRSAVKTSADDEMSLLLAVGADPVGDVQVVPEGMVPAAAEFAATVSGSFQEIDFVDLLESAGIDPSAIAGVQDKVSGRMITVPLAHRGRGHFLKLTPPEFPAVVENEAYFLQVAKRLKHPVTVAEVVHDKVNRSGLLVTRFDRFVDAAGVMRARAVEDAAQLLGRYPADKYSVTSEQAVVRIGEVCAARPLALRNAFTQLCFAWVTGNGDLHGKNISVVSTDDEWRVAPIYDIPSTLPYGDHTMALSLDGHRDGLSRNRILAFADRVGLARRAAERVVDEVLAATDRVVEDLSNGAVPLDDSRLRNLVRGLRHRRTLLS